MDRDEIIRVLRAFETSGLEYVLIGAAAMGFHGLVRATEDLDLFIRATAENVERLRVSLRDAYGGDPHIEEISADDLPSATIRRPATCTSMCLRAWATRPGLKPSTPRSRRLPALT
jgi:hypothetical protein